MELPGGHVRQAPNGCTEKQGLPMQPTTTATVDCIESNDSVKSYFELETPRRTHPVERAFDGFAFQVRRSAVALRSERVFVTLSVADVLNLVGVVALVLLLTTAALALFGCGSPEGLLATSPQSASVASAETPVGIVGSPLRIVIFEDETGSRLQTRTPQLTTEQLQQLIALCESHTGEIAFGVIRDESNNLFERLTIGPPPVVPVKTTATGTNAIDIDAAQAELDAKYQKEETAYGADIKNWKNVVAEREKRFVQSVTQLLQQPPDAQRTDVNGGVARADLFLGEDGAMFGKPTHRYLLLISDGQDNIHKPVASLPPNTTVIVVNGVGSVGNLAPFNPLRFESIDAALNYIAAKEAAPAASR